MKKIINGKKYNTETAKMVGNASANCSCTDFGYWYEELYLKKTGEFFLYGHGGAASKYAESCGQNSWSGGEDIAPLTKEKAVKWAEKYLSIEEYEEVFGEVEE